MAGRFEIWGRKHGAAQGPDAREPDIAVTQARRWALGLMIVASASALLVTSDPNDAKQVTVFEKSSDGPRTTLSAGVPSKRYLIRLRVDALGPDRRNSVDSAEATVHGTITPNALATDNGGSPFVRARYGAVGQTPDERSVLTSFQFARPLAFSGNCSEPTQGTPCQAEVELDLTLERPDALPSGASVSVDWTIDGEGRAYQSNAGNGDPLEAPWTIEISER